jgi:AraC-like DNA-binding protein
MINYYRYLPVSKEDEDWGLCVLNAGCSRIEKGVTYPPMGHPASHYFNWNQGRILHDEYQLIYIVEGEGIFESKSSKQEIITAGSVIMLFPEEWHRFKPNEETGWIEYWVGFKGSIVERLVQNYFFTPKSPVLHIGLKTALQNIFIEVIDTTTKEKAGYQPLISGCVLHLLGFIHHLVKQKEFKEEDTVETIVNKARILLRENIDEDISVEEIAKRLQVSYSWFRKIFKVYTGIAPGQYLIQLRIEKAKALLSVPSKTIKEIADELKFESVIYFARLFKEKTGLTPAKYRKMFAIHDV